MQPLPRSFKTARGASDTVLRSILLGSMATCMCLGLGAPPLAAEPTVNAQTAPRSSGPAPADANSNEKLRAAAEPFEKLTEIAFKSSASTIDRTIGQAERAATEVRRLLSDDAAGRLNAQVAAVKAARQKQDRAGLALASIEAYRILVSAVSDSAKIPTGVNLLDYAGFRYDADLKANPIRWSDMAEAVSIAHENWAKLLPRAKAFPQATAFEKTLADMDEAVTGKNGSLAVSSVKAELNLVDELEKFFSTH